MLHVAADAVGAAWLDGPRSAMAGFLVGLLATFLFVRINTRLIRAKVSWWFHDIESEGGTHVHHMVIGVVLMVTVGICLIALAARTTCSPRSLALLFGVGVALTLDEFALILQPAGRVLAQGGAALRRRRGHRRLRGGAVRAGAQPVRRPRRPRAERQTCSASPSPLWVIVVDRPGAVLPAQGQDLDRGARSVRAARGDRRGDPARAARSRRGRGGRYAKKPKKLAKAQRREARLDARWIAWRDAFFDLIAGKPHLPSLPPLGPTGSR